MVANTVNDEVVKAVSEEETETQVVSTGIKIHRVAFKSKNAPDDGRKRFYYEILGEIRGRKVKVNVDPKDIGGYQLLDIVFDSEENVDLIVESGVRKNDLGELVPYNSYFAQSVEDGMYFRCPIKPKEGSDKAMLECLLGMNVIKEK